MQVDFAAAEQRVKADYSVVAERYRLDDEIEVETENHGRLSALFRSICRAFTYPIKVLDAGCGTGRHFHCLENVAELVGVDISSEMLAAARNPVRARRITAKAIELRRANIHSISFPAATFDFIYSLGMFGHACPATTALCQRFYQWLKPGGQLFFNAVDIAGLPVVFQVRQRLRKFCYPRLPARLRQLLDRRAASSPFFALSRRELIALLRATSFRSFSVVSHACRSPLWSGRHLECLASKDFSAA